MNAPRRRIVLIVGNFAFPDGNAAGKRVWAIAQMVRALGLTPVVAGTDERVANTTAVGATGRTIDGIASYALPYPRRLRDWLGWRAQVDRVKELGRLCGEENILAVITYGSAGISCWIDGVRHWAYRYGIGVLADCTDWIENSGRSPFFNFIKYCDTNYQNRIAIPRGDGALCVSGFFSGYLAKKGVYTQLVPPLMDAESVEVRARQALAVRKERDVRVFVYAGIPFHCAAGVPVENFKDRLDRTVELFGEMARAQKKFVFHVYGVTVEQYLLVLPRHRQLLELLGERIVFHGLCPMPETEAAVLNADFVVLNRDRNRKTLAGFPSKISEAVTLGVPVIVDPVGDLAQYVRDGENGLIFQTHRPANTLKFAIEMPRESVTKMAEVCLAEKKFDWRTYVPRLNLLLQHAAKTNFAE